MEAFSTNPRLRVLIDHLAMIKDTRQSWKVAYPLREVLFLVVCGTIASGDDYDDIVDWGEAHLSFLRRFAEFHHGIPCADWLRTVMNRIDPELFAACFSSWVADAGQTSPISLPSTARPRAAATERGARRPCLWCRPLPPAASSCWARRRSTKNQMRSPPSRPFWNASILRAPWYRSTLWDATQRPSLRPRPTISGRKG
jgi:hypothetical protein